MFPKDIGLKKGMLKDEVNNLISEILLEDQVYLGNKYKHNWRCKCGSIFTKKWNSIQRGGNIICKECISKLYKTKHRQRVIDVGHYEYIDSYFKNDVLPNGSISKNIYVMVKHKYCGITNVIPINSIHKNVCPNCCKLYENSFAYHIEVELGLKLEDVWDFEKNTVNPYHISKNTHKKVWIKCQDKEYHGSYEVSCLNFVNGCGGCSYCRPNGQNPKVHPYDSFGYRNFDKVMSWHPDNEISPFRVNYGSQRKYKFICNNCENVWESSLHHISYSKSWCPACSVSKGEKKIRYWLDKSDINYTYDKPYFKDLLSDKGNLLRPDFILPEHKIWIEYDGEFHYKKIYENDGYEIIKEHDKRKNEYAKKNGWKLIRIPYWEFDNIEKILEVNVNGG